MAVFICYKQTFKILIPPLLVIVRESNRKYVLMCFEFYKRHDIKKYQNKR